MNAAPSPIIPGLERPEPIGRGGFGVVYVADEPAFGRRVAVKVLTDRIGDDDARRGFERECQAMGTLSGHPHIVAVHRGGATERGEPYIVMEFMTGGSLADRLAERGPLSWFEVLDIGVLLAGALETAHRAGILHLDVKPANVLVSRFAEPALGDFGISRLPGVTVTMDGRVRATVTYSAPERLVGGVATVATDLYALGATLFALLTGAPAFAGESGEDLVVTAARVLREPVPDLRARGVPGPLADVVERLLAKDPGDRPASALEAANLLQEAQRATGQPVTRPVVEGVNAAQSEGPTVATARPRAGAESAPLPPSWPPASASGPAWPPGAETVAPGSSWADAGAAKAPAHPSSWRQDSGDHTPVLTAAEAAAARSSAPAQPPAWPGSPATPHGAAGSWLPPPRPRPRRRRNGWLIGGVAAALVVVVGAVTTLVLLNRAQPVGPVVPTPTFTATPAPPATTTATPVPSAVAVAPGVTHPATADVARVLDAYVSGINDRRYSDAFALFSPDNPTARKGLDAWVTAESTTQIRAARLLSVRDGTGGSVTAEMTFTSTQDAEYGFDGQTCSQWDLVYDLAGPGPDWRIHLASTRADPKPC